MQRQIKKHNNTFATSAFWCGRYSVECEGSLKNSQSLNWRVKYLLPFRKVERLYINKGKRAFLSRKMKINRFSGRSLLFFRLITYNIDEVNISSEF